MEKNYDDTYEGLDNDSFDKFLGTCRRVFGIVLLVGIICFIVYAIIFY